MDFWEYAQNSASGSVNKFTSWTKIREYEFLLPPKDQQSKIAELLWAMDDVVEKNLQIYEKLQISLDSTIEKEIHGCELYDKTINEVIKEIDKKIGMISINEIGHILKGKGIPKKDLSEKGKPCIRYGELYTKHHRTINKYYSFIDKSKINTTVLLRKDDVLFAGSGETIEEIGKSASFISNDEVYAGGDILILRTENMNGFYLGFLMNSLVVRKQLNKYGTGATVIHIYPDDIKKIMIPNLDKQKQDKIAIKFKNYANNISLIINKIKQSKQLQKSLINEIFSS